MKPDTESHGSRARLLTASKFNNGPPTLSPFSTNLYGRRGRTGPRSVTTAFANWPARFARFSIARNWKFPKRFNPDHCSPEGPAGKSGKADRGFVMNWDLLTSESFTFDRAKALDFAARHAGLPHSPTEREVDPNRVKKLVLVLREGRALPFNWATVLYNGQ